jgi:hypothetical protein
MKERENRIGILASLIAAAILGALQLGWSHWRKREITNGLLPSVPDNGGLELDTYQGIHRSPYLYIKNATALPIRIAAVKLAVKGYGLLEARQQTVLHEPVSSDVLPPGGEGKWQFTPGVDIPTEWDELLSCTILAACRSLLGAEVLFAIPVTGGHLDTLRDQLKNNKRNWK